MNFPSPAGMRVNHLELIRSIPAISPKISHLAFWESRVGTKEIQVIFEQDQKLTDDDVKILQDVFKTDKVGVEVGATGRHSAKIRV